MPNRLTTWFFQSDKKIMVDKRLRKPLVCWARNMPSGAVADTTIVEPGETVRIRENEDRRTKGRMLVMVRNKMVYCSRAEFWRSVN
jgi:hypothetical protein